MENSFDIFQITPKADHNGSRLNAMGHFSFQFKLKIDGIITTLI